MNKMQEQRSQRFAQLIGLELKSVFVKKEVTQSSVADALGHSRGGFSKWINAKPSMPMEVLINVCEYLGIDPRTIIDNAYAQLTEEMGVPGNSVTFDASQLDDDQLITEVAKRGDSGTLSIAALRDKNKKRLIDGEAGD